MRLRTMIVACVLSLVGCAALTGNAAASEPFTDQSAGFVSLKVNTAGEALVTYRRADGKLRRVLVWGAVNAGPPLRGVPQVHLLFDYAGGWRKYRNGSYWKSFRNACKLYDGPQLAYFVAACKAPDGTYWALQTWQRNLPHRGFEPWLSRPDHVRPADLALDR